MIRTLTSKCTLAGQIRSSLPRHHPGPMGAVVLLVADLVSTWYLRVRERRHLRALDDHMLKDIGVTRADVEFEVQKHFWRP
ncbi:MAG TPA: DUF1127 domain-containing protein [Candidatus Acidoferrum sp.]|nr:DUF1127 domain-containing protein [Candidatus Acidoferrum sp.]